MGWAGKEKEGRGEERRGDVGRMMGEMGLTGSFFFTWLFSRLGREREGGDGMAFG